MMVNWLLPVLQMPSRGIGHLCQSMPPILDLFCILPESFFMFSKSFMKASGLFPYNSWFHFKENRKNHLCTTRVLAVNNHGKFIQAPSWIRVVSQENNNWESWFFNSLEESWWDGFSSLEFFIIVKYFDSLFRQSVM